MARAMQWACVGVMAAGFTFPALVAEKLRGVIRYNVRTVNQKLDKAEKLLRAGDMKQAAMYLEAAETPWNSIHKDYKDRIDPNHPEIVATRKRLAALKARIGAKAGAANAPVESEPVKNAPVKKLKGIIGYNVRNVNTSLDRAERSLRAGDPKRATAYLKGAETVWNGIHRDYKDRIDPKHPEIVATRTRLSNVKAKVG
jgi:soluble cytochrome b562